jgi:hypothetical protein
VKAAKNAQSDLGLHATIADTGGNEKQQKG